jgi:hypothetical protein
VADFYTDHNVARAVAEFLRVAGHAAVTARGLGLEEASDDEQLLTAAQHNRIFITHNESDFILLYDAWQRWASAWGVPAAHAGILIVPQGRRYGIDWDARQISQEVLLCHRICSPLSNALLQRNEPGWSRRLGRG